MREDLLDDGPRGDARDDPHRPAAPRARQWVHLKNLPQQLRPATPSLAEGEREGDARRRPTILSSGAFSIYIQVNLLLNAGPMSARR
ncbi:MAG TPA: hypothetical protein VIK25_08830 [Gemmatimonadaceae bacterium]